MQNNQDTWDNMYMPGDKSIRTSSALAAPNNITNVGNGYSYKSYDGKEWPTLKLAMEYNDKLLKSMKINPDSLLYNTDGRTTDLYDIENRSR